MTAEDLEITEIDKEDIKNKKYANLGGLIITTTAKKMIFGHQPLFTGKEVKDYAKQRVREEKKKWNISNKGYKEFAKDVGDAFGDWYYEKYIKSKQK